MLATVRMHFKYSCFRYITYLTGNKGKNFKIGLDKFVKTNQHCSRIGIISFSIIKRTVKITFNFDVNRP